MDKFWKIACITMAIAILGAIIGSAIAIGELLQSRATYRIVVTNEPEELRTLHESENTAGIALPSMPSEPEAVIKSKHKSKVQ